jgi:hypothetical protein
LGKIKVGGGAEKPGDMAKHLEKVVGGAIRHASSAIWWKNLVPLGNGAARRHGGVVAMWW